MQTLMIAYQKGCRKSEGTKVIESTAFGVNVMNASLEVKIAILR